MKFKDIKVGDTVFVAAQVQLSWGVTRSFFIPVVVDSVSPTRFKVGSDVFSKEYGHAHGKSNKFNQVFLLGDQSSYLGKVIDQSQEKVDFEYKLSLINSIKDLISKIKINHMNLDKFSNEELLNINEFESGALKRT